MMRGRRRRWLWPILSVVLGVAACAPASSPSTTDVSLVRTNAGQVRGTAERDVRSFLGIPFAAPPVGDLRWRPPRPAAPWSGVRAATAFGGACAQAPGPLAANTGQGSTTEDCLYLNVYTPNPVHRDLPVMVWIHGGGFTEGAPSQYDPRLLSAKGRAVIVTIAYRLGPFGFLALPGLSAEAGDRSSGDYGLMDQQEALRWVQLNIAAFGGSPRNVTIFGESAGGLSVCANLASPTARGLFARAITESGPCSAPLTTVAAGETAGAALAARLGCADAATQVSCLRALPASALMGATGSFGPKVGGPVLPTQLAAAITSGAFNRVPVIEGTNHDEDRLFVALQFDLIQKPVTADQYPAMVQASYGARAAAVLAAYPLGRFSSPSLAWATVVTDSRFSCPARVADAMLSAQVPTFAYEFNDPNAPEFIVRDPVMPLGAFHAAELGFLFPPRNPGSFAHTPAEAALSDQMIGYWSKFAAAGDPNGSGAPAWPHYDRPGDRFQSLAPGATKTITTFADDHQCALWASPAAA